MASPMQKYLEHIIKSAPEKAAGVQIQFKGDLHGQRAGTVRLLADFAPLFEMTYLARVGTEDGPQVAITLVFSAEEVAFVLYSPDALSMGAPERASGGLVT